MFVLDTDIVPTTPAELNAAIHSSLAKWILLPTNATAIKITGKMPNLSSMAVDVSRGLIDSVDSIPVELASGETQPGPTAATFTIIGHPISVADIPVQLDLTATKAVFAYARNPNKKLIATLQDAEHGDLSIQLTQTDLEAAAVKIARQFAGDKVAMEKIDIKLTSVSPTQVDVLLTIAAKKFVTAIVRVSGRITIDDRMVATAANLKASADGFVGNIAVNLLQPHLQKLQGRPLPLLAFSLGNVKLRGVEIRTTNGLQITASFGS